MSLSAPKLTAAELQLYTQKTDFGCGCNSPRRRPQMFINTSFLYPGKCFHTLANIPFFCVIGLQSHGSHLPTFISDFQLSYFLVQSKEDFIT
jgi:hypothetical protein